MAKVIQEKIYIIKEDEDIGRARYRGWNYDLPTTAYPRLGIYADQAEVYELDLEVAKEIDKKSKR
jgi:hypothetical protein